MAVAEQPVRAPSPLREAAQVAARLAPLAYAAALTTSCIVDGLPLEHDQLFFWIGLGLVSVTLSAPRRLARGVLEWVPILLLLVAYDLLRGAVSVSDAAAHLTPQLDVDRIVGFGAVPTVWLQAHLYSAGHIHPWDVLAWATYLTHFFTVWVVAAVIWRVRHERFARFAGAAVVLTLMAFATYWLYPAQPPWMAAQEGSIGPVTRIVPTVWDAIGVRDAGSLYGSRDLVNLVAAVPSLHAAYPVLLLRLLWSDAPRPARVVLVCYPLLMGFALVYGGEHFVFDVVLGWLYAVGAVAVVDVVRRATSALPHR